MADQYEENHDGADDIYDDKAVEEMLEEGDAISPEEEAFMQGYNEPIKKKKKKKSKSL